MTSKKTQLDKTVSALSTVSAVVEKLSLEIKESSGHVEDAKSSMAAQNEKGQVLSALLRQKERGAMPGMCGRLVRGVCGRMVRGVCCEGHYILCTPIQESLL